MEKKTLCFDLDGTLCTNTFGDYESAEPFPWAIERLNALARAGHRIVVFTARGTATGIDWEGTTRGQLDRWGVAYDDLHFGKPSADVYVDDRAVHTTAWQLSDAFEAPGLIAPEGDEELPTVPAAPLPAAVEIGRTFAGEPARLREHVEELTASARRLGVPAIAPGDEVLDAAAERIASARSRFEGEVVFALAVAPGGHAAYADVPEPAGSGPVSVACRPLDPIAAGLKRFTVGNGDQGGAASVGATLRSGSPVDLWPLYEDELDGVSDALGGRLAVVHEGAITLQPGHAAAVYAGWLVELAHEAGLSVEERAILRSELRDADEALLVGCPHCLLPIGHVDDDRLGAPQITRRLLDLWGEKAGVNLAAGPGSARGLAGVAGGSDA